MVAHSPIGFTPQVITAIAAFGSFIAYIYSAPPLKLKANGWTGTYALGSSYIALPWWCGHAMFNAGSIGWQARLARRPVGPVAAHLSQRRRARSRPRCRRWFSPCFTPSPVCSYHRRSRCLPLPTLLSHAASCAAPGLGIAIVNDFKSIEGEPRVGHWRLPVGRRLCVPTRIVAEQGIASSG